MDFIDYYKSRGLDEKQPALKEIKKSVSKG